MATGHMATAMARSARHPSLDAVRPNGRALPMRPAATAAPRPAGPVTREAGRDDNWPGDAPALLELSPREREIARLVAHGMVNKTIGAVLDISPWTVATHLRRIFAKLGVTSRASMVAAICAMDARRPG